MTRMPAALAEGAEAEGARRATAVSVTSIPLKKERRRRSIGSDPHGDACKKPGELGALLRREGLYSSLLTNWRRQREGRLAGHARTPARTQAEAG